MKDVVLSCRYIHLSDWGSYSCLLFNPYTKNGLVQYGTCEANVDCPYKRNLNTINKIQELCKNADLYRGRQALATKILQVIDERKV